MPFGSPVRVMSISTAPSRCTSTASPRDLPLASLMSAVALGWACAGPASNDAHASAAAAMVTLITPSLAGVCAIDASDITETCLGGAVGHARVAGDAVALLTGHGGVIPARRARDAAPVSVEGRAARADRLGHAGWSAGGGLMAAGRRR